MIEEIKTYVAAFIRCPTAQVYYRLKRKGCISKGVNCLIGKCFTVEQQQKVTKSRYLKEKGVAVMKDSDEDDIINAANKTGLLDMSLTLSDKEQRERWPNPDTMNQQGVDYMAPKWRQMYSISPCFSRPLLFFPV